MLNVTIEGVASLEGGGTSFNYQAFFHKVNGASSPSQWNAVQASTDGYFSLNLGDGDFLTQDGAAGAGDVVVVAFWSGQAGREEDSGYTHLVWYEVVLTSEFLYTLTPVLVLAHPQTPTQIITLDGVPASWPRLTNRSFTNSSLYTPGSEETFGRARQMAWYTDAFEDPVEAVFPSLRVFDTLIDWGYPSTEESFPFGTYGEPPFSLVHQWSEAPGTELEVRSRAVLSSGAEDTTPQVDTVQITARTPVGGFSWLPASPTVEDVVTFTPAITDADGVVTSVDYLVDGSPAEAGLGVGDSWQYQFATNGPHAVRQVVHWHDGFAPQSFNFDRTVTVANIVPTSGWDVSSQGTFASRYTWVSTAEDVDGTVALYAWLLERSDGEGSWLFEASASGPGMDSFAYSFATEGLYRLTHTATDDDGGQGAHQEEFNVTIESAAQVLIIPLSSD